jgi:hypothetical protein
VLHELLDVYIIPLFGGSITLHYILRWSVRSFRKLHTSVVGKYLFISLVPILTALVIVKVLRETQVTQRKGNREQR